jgi:Putative auto-transporter adhesin, head GIN domain
MIRTIAFLIAFAAASQAPAADRRIPVDDFDRVIVEGPYVVHLVTGRASAASANGTREALDRLSLDVQGQTLRIRRNRNGWVGTPGADSGIVTIELATRSLRSARLIGPARFEVANVRGINVEFSVEGSGSLRAAGVDADNLSLALLGSGRLEVGGAARVLRGDFQGSGEVAAAGLRAGNATVTTTTSGAVALTVNGPATITANGLAEVRVYGRPDCTIRGIAADQVRCGGSDQRQIR